jgi:hypothetical protein
MISVAALACRQARRAFGIASEIAPLDDGLLTTMTAVRPRPLSWGERAGRRAVGRRTATSSCG